MSRTPIDSKGNTTCICKVEDGCDCLETREQNERDLREQIESWYWNKVRRSTHEARLAADALIALFAEERDKKDWRYGWYRFCYGMIAALAENEWMSADYWKQIAADNKHHMDISAAELGAAQAEIARLVFLIKHTPIDELDKAKTEIERLRELIIKAFKLDKAGGRHMIWCKSNEYDFKHVKKCDCGHDDALVILGEV